MMPFNEELLSSFSNPKLVFFVFGNRRALSVMAQAVSSAGWCELGTKMTVRVIKEDTGSSEDWRLLSTGAMI